MTMQFSSSIANLMAGRGILQGFNVTVQATTFPSCITIYSGSQPSAAAVTAAWSSYNSTNAAFLAHFPGASWTNPSAGTLVQLSVPAAVNASNSGTAAWAIVWQSSYTLAQMGTGTLPNAAFLVVPVSLNTGNGVIRMTNLTVTSGTSTSIYDGSIGSTSP